MSPCCSARPTDLLASNIHGRVRQGYAGSVEVPRIATPLARACFRLANSLITADRMIRISRGRGVKLIVDGGERGVLLVRHTYGNRHWTLPGGRVRRTESTASAAKRELAEELALEGRDLVPLGSYPVRVHRRQEVVEVFATSEAAEVVPNPVEISVARWFSRSRLPDDLDPSVAVALGLLDGRRAEAAAGIARRPTA